MSFHEIPISDICKYKDPFSLFSEGGLTVVESNGQIDPMTIGWGALGTLWSKRICTVYIHASRYSKVLFDQADRFAVCFLKPEYRKQLDYCGNVSLRDEDKAAKSGMTLVRDCGIPFFEECELVILCKKIGQSDFDPKRITLPQIASWYTKEGPHTIYQGEIIKVLVSD